MEFVRMKGPLGKGHAEMAVSKTKNSDYVTPDGDGQFPIQGWEGDFPLPDDSSDLGFPAGPGVPPSHLPPQPTTAEQRRMSDPSNNMNSWNGFRGRATGSVSHFPGGYGQGVFGGRPGNGQGVGAPLKKSTSEQIKTATYSVAEDGTHEVTAASPTEELREDDEYASLFGTAFGQAWYWLKGGRERLQLHSMLMLLMSPSHGIGS